jgi:hypothetical protein
LVQKIGPKNWSKKLVQKIGPKIWSQKVVKKMVQKIKNKKPILVPRTSAFPPETREADGELKKRNVIGRILDRKN